MKLRLLLIAVLGCLTLSQVGCGLAASQAHRAGRVLTSPLRALSSDIWNPLSSSESSQV